MPRIVNYTPNALTQVGGSDLGAPFIMPNGKVGLVQGDTWDGTVAKTGSGPWWRSPVILTSPTRNPGANALAIDGAVRGGDQLWAYPHNNGTFTTVLPCDAITIGGRIYIWVMVTNGLADPNIPGSGELWCEIWYSDDNGENWINSADDADTPWAGYKWSTSEYGGKRTMITWERGRDGFVYIVSTGGLLRNKNAHMWRVPEADIRNPNAWQAWGFAGGAWNWGNPPTDILPSGTMAGEMCLRWIQGHWVLSYLELNQGATTVKVGYSGVPATATSAPNNINWMTTATYRPIRSGPLAIILGGEAMERFYGCYVHPDSRFDGKFSLIMSEWLLQAGAPYNGEGPYRSSHWRMKTTPTALGPLIQDPAPADADEWDIVMREFTG